MAYVKLDSGILESSVWAEDSDTLRVWIYLLAKADSIGVVYATMPGIAVQCGLPLEKVREVLERFAGPDPDSRDPGKDGRRISIIREPEFCIEVLNHSRYRAKSLTHAERQARYRRLHRDAQRDEKSPESDAKSRKVTQGRRHKAEEREEETGTETRTGRVPRPVFVKPTLQELEEHVRSHGCHFTAAAFMAHYNSNGWKVGRNAMKSWQDACRTWEERWKSDHPQQIRPGGEGRDFSTRPPDFVIGDDDVPDPV